MSDFVICPYADDCQYKNKPLCPHAIPHKKFVNCHFVCDYNLTEDMECAPFVPKNKITQVRIIMGNYWGACFVTFRTQFDIDNDLAGRRYRNPSPEGLERLSRLLYEQAVPWCFIDHEQGEIIFGDQTPLPGLFGWTTKKDRTENNGSMK